MRVELQLQHKLHLAMGSIKDHASVGMALIYNRHAFRRDIEVAVVRATSHGGAAAVDDKYVHQILFLVSNDPKCALFLADRLTCRLHKTRDLPVALKTLVLVHRLLRGGNGWFEKRLRSAHGSGHLQLRFTTTHHFLNNHPDFFSGFLQKYAVYVSKRLEWAINQAGKLEPVVVTAPQIQDYPDAVLHKIKKGQELLDKIILLDNSSAVSIIENRYCSGDQSGPNLLLAALSNTLKESFEVYRTVWEGITFIVSEFFELRTRARASAIEILRKASEQNEQISRFYGDCKRIIIDGKNLDYPSVHVITLDHIVALEQLRSDSAAAAGRKKEARNTGGAAAAGFGSPFSLTKETKINKVWVVFDDQDEPDDDHKLHQPFS